MDPEESEVAYQLKAQMMKNMEAQNSKLQTELKLHEKMTEIKLLHSQNKKLQDESKLSHSNMVKLLHRFEKKAKQTDEKLASLEDEVNRSMRLAFRYKEMYDHERQQNRGKGGHSQSDSKAEEKDKMPTLSRQKTPSTVSLVGNSMKIDDIIKKNEILLEENESLKKEIAKLRQDNSNLLKKTKHALADRDSVIHDLETCRMSREDLLKRYQKEKAQHQLLAKALTQQAENYVMSKRLQQQMEENSRWRVVYNDRAGPISPYSASHRTFCHSVPKNVDQPRGMIPVQNYASANQTTA